MTNTGTHQHDAPAPIGYGNGCRACDEWAIRQPITSPKEAPVKNRISTPNPFDGQYEADGTPTAETAEAIEAFTAKAIAARKAEQHTITAIEGPLPPSTPGALDSFVARCSCGYDTYASIKSLAREWGEEHARYMNSPAGRHWGR